MPADWDLIVVGAGPAGCAAAAAARQADPAARVLLVDRAEFPRDKVCGDGIAAAALEALAGLDIDVDQLVDGFPRLDRLLLRSPRGVVAERSAAQPSWVVPREVFDARLREAVIAKGVATERHRVRQIERAGDDVDVDGHWRAGTVIVAGGAEAGLGATAGRPSFAVGIRGYARTRREDVQSLVMSDIGWPAYAWSFPIGNGWANVGYGEAVTKRRSSTRQSLLRSLRELAPDVESEPERLRAHRLPLAMRRPDLGVGRVLRVGDAAGLVNPMSGEGIYYAVHSGAAAGAAALRVDPMTTYRRAMVSRHRRHAALLTASLRRVPRLLEAGIAAAAADQRIFDDLVDLALADGVLTGRMLRTVATRSVRRS